MSRNGEESPPRHPRVASGDLMRQAKDKKNGGIQMKTYLIINETHSLLPDQVRELEEKGMAEYEEIRIPKERK